MVPAQRLSLSLYPSLSVLTSVRPRQPLHFLQCLHYVIICAVPLTYAGFKEPVNPRFMPEFKHDEIQKNVFRAESSRMEGVLRSHYNSFSTVIVYKRYSEQRCI